MSASGICLLIKNAFVKRWCFEEWISIKNAFMGCIYGMRWLNAFCLSKGEGLLSRYMNRDWVIDVLSHVNQAL